MESVKNLEALRDSSVSVPSPKPYTLYSWTLCLATEGEIGWENSERIAEDWQGKNKSKWWESGWRFDHFQSSMAGFWT